MTCPPEHGRRRCNWTRADIRAARQKPLKPFLERLGYRLTSAGGSNFRITGCPPERKGQAAGIVIKHHYWTDPENGAAGNAIDFMVKIIGMRFNQAMQLLLS